MALQQRSAPARPPYPVRGPAPRTSPRPGPRSGRGSRLGSGLVHVTHRHRERFTVVGNHLAQHRELSLLAIGLAVHIQSVPDGTRVDIKSLTARFPEGETRIAGALRELEAHGYLARTTRRTPGGCMVTRTVSYAHPEEVRAPEEPTRPAPQQRAQPTAQRTVQPATQPAAQPATQPATEPATQPVTRLPVPPPPKPPLPAPRTPDPVRQETATALLAALRRDDERLLLSERDVSRLSPAVDAWLERGTKVQTVRQALTARLPTGLLHHPAAFLGQRLTALLPPPLPDEVKAPGPDPFQECPACERPFRAPRPGHCRSCRACPASPGQSPGDQRRPAKT